MQAWTVCYSKTNNAQCPLGPVVDRSVERRTSSRSGLVRLALRPRASAPATCGKMVKYVFPHAYDESMNWFGGGRVTLLIAYSWLRGVNSQSEYLPKVAIRSIRITLRQTKGQLRGILI